MYVYTGHGSATTPWSIYPRCREFSFCVCFPCLSNDSTKRTGSRTVIATARSILHPERRWKGRAEDASTRVFARGIFLSADRTLANHGMQHGLV